MCDTNKPNEEKKSCGKCCGGKGKCARALEKAAKRAGEKKADGAAPKTDAPKAPKP